MKQRIIKFNGFELEAEYEMNGNECVLNHVYQTNPDKEIDWIWFVNKAEFNVIESIIEQIETEEAEEADDGFDDMEYGEMKRDAKKDEYDSYRI